MSGERELSSRSALPLRNSRARTIVSGTMRKMTLCSLRAPRKQLGLLSRITASSCAWLTKQKGPLPMGWREKSDVETIDLMQFHTWEDRWLNDERLPRSIEAMKKSGKVRACGISVNR